MEMKSPTSASKVNRVSAKVNGRNANSLRGEFVYAELRAAIGSGRLLPGERLRETEIADQLGVSRTPVREALKRLETDGLVAFNQPRGLIVNELTQAQILELYSMREVLEGAAARFAGEQASSLEIDSLKHLLAVQLAAKTPADAAAANRQLHDAIARAAHNEYLLRAMNVLTDALALLGETTYAVPGRMESGARENAEIVEAIANRDSETAERSARRHILAAVAVRLGMRLGKASLQSAAPSRRGGSRRKTDMAGR
jgi:DNA-binding GntR family transcriptional regulator